MSSVIATAKAQRVAIARTSASHRSAVIPATMARLPIGFIIENSVAMNVKSAASVSTR